MSSQPPKVSFDTEHLWQMMFDEGRLVSVEKYTTDYSAPVAAAAAEIVVVKAEPKDNEYNDDDGDDDDDDGEGDDYNQFLGLDDSFLFDIDGSGNVSLPTGPSTSSTTSSSSSSSSSSNATKKTRAVQPALAPSAKAPLGYTASGAPRKRRAPASKPDLRNVRPHSEQRVSTPSDQRRQAARTTRNALRSKQPPVAAPLARMKEILASLKTRGKQSTNRAEYHEQVEDIVRNLQQAVESAQETASTFQNQRESILLTIRRMLMELYISRNNLAVLHAREYGGSVVHIPVGHSTMQHSTTYTPPYSPLVPVNPFHGREVEDVHYNRRKETASMPINTRLAETSKAVRGQGSYVH